MAAAAMTNVGKGFLWFVFSWMALNAMGIFVLAFTKHPQHRLFHYISFTVVAVAALCYLTMAVDLGIVTGGNRDWYIGRYVDWIVTTPLLLLDLGTYAKLSPSNIFALIVLDLLMIFAGMSASFATGPSKWALFTFGAICFVPILYFLNEDFDMERTIENLGEAAAKSYKKLGYFLGVFWCIYPVAWILATTNAISVDGEIIFWGILDIMSKSVFASWLLSCCPDVEEEEDMELAKEAEEGAVELTVGEFKTDA